MKYIFGFNNKIYQKITFLIFISSTIATYIIGELYFFVSKSTDFNKYIKYIDYFQFSSETTHTGQGLIYYYLVSAVTFLRKNIATNLNYLNFINSNVHLTNSMLYIVGVYGFYKLLIKYNFSKTSIYLSFIVLNFSLPIFIMRSILKPEILAFSLLPWVIYGLILYFEKPSFISFLILAPVISILLNIKGSITGMVLLLLLFIFYKDIKKNFKLNILYIFLIALSFILIANENTKINNYNVFEHNLTEESKYDNKATYSFFTNINLKDLYFFPVYPYHNNSAFGITVLDSFGDYFNLFSNYDENLFFHNSKEIFLSQITDARGFRLGHYVAKYWSIIFTTMFYLLGIFYTSKKKDSWPLYLSPLIGLLVLTLSALGIPFNHFDPNVGDTFKSNYYSFLIGLSLLFIFTRYFQKQSILKNLTLIFFIFMFFNSLGFPKENQESINFYLQEKVEISPFCRVTSFFNKDFDSENCNNKHVMFCEYNLASNEAKSVKSYKRIEENINFDNAILFLDENNKLISASNVDQCNEFVLNKYKTFNPQLQNLRKLPFFNTIFLYLSIISLIYFSLKES